jgi:hypothetical protein
MTLPHAIYGSTTGLGDYRILASSAQLDERLRSTIIYYSNLEGSARSTPFAPIFSFYALGDDLWAVSRTVCLGPTPRGNDYLVHAVILDAEQLASLEHRPFALVDAQMFISHKPHDGSVLQPLSFAAIKHSKRAFRFDSTSIASSLRALSRGPLRLRIDDDQHATDVCREIHESLPPEDRRSTTFCTRFSYGRNLAFALAAFTAEDEPRVREAAPDAAVADFPPPRESAMDLFDRWATEVRGQADLDLIGISILRDPNEALALVDCVQRLRHWSAQDGDGDIRALEKASALVLREENRARAIVQSVLPGAWAVDLSARIRAGEALEACTRRWNEIESAVRRDVVLWIQELQTTPVEAWIAEMLLLLTDRSAADVSEGLQRLERDRALLAALFVQDATLFRRFLATLFAQLRDRFGADGAPLAMAVAPRLAAHRDALLTFVRVMEETASSDADPDRRTAWLLTITGDTFLGTNIAPAIPARIILSNALLPSIDDASVEALAPAFFILEEKLAGALATTPAQARPTLYRALANVLQMRLREGWTPRSDAATDIVRRVLVGAVQADADPVTLTIITFLASRSVAASDVVLAIESVAARGATEAQASLLLRTLQSLGRRREATTSVSRATWIALLTAARHRPPQSLWNRLSWYLRVRALTEVAG